MTVANHPRRQTMKRLVLAAVLALMLVPAAPAAAAGPTLKSLQAQITTLKKQVKTLQKQVKADRSFSLASLAYSGCSFAATADALQGTWTALDARFVSEGHVALFGAQTPVDDFGVCQAFQIVRAKNQNPPTVGVFQALLNVFK
jgi:ABC-type transport system involved in cytochrome c biogenesis permease subunit